MTAAETPTLTDDVIEPTITDVWSRTAPKYRVRAVLLLLVNLVLFAGLGCFAYWLRTGQLFAPAADDYWGLLGRTFMPRGAATLSNFVQFPISLEAVPTHGVVVGLLMAALVSIPILIAILYRFPCSLPFIAVVAFLGVMPWLAINLLGACIIATIKPLRFRFRYISALLGLLLVMLYFYGASRQTAPAVAAIKPEDRIKFIAPWVLATLASCAIMGIVLFLSRVVNYRPGVVAPLLLIAFAAPVVVFEKYVGRDELYYRLLERDYQRQFALQEHLAERDVSDWFDSVARNLWLSKPEPRPAYETVRELTEFRLALEMGAETNQRSVFAQLREQMSAACDHFIRHFPDSRYAPNALYLKGETLDMRIDLQAFFRHKVIRYYDDFPSPQSEFTWKRVVHNAPNSTTSAVGRFRLAIFAARRGEFDEALALLEDVVRRYDANGTTPKGSDSPGLVKKVLQSKPADASLRIPLDVVLSDVRKFHDLLANNRHDPTYGPRPFCGSLPREPHQAGLLQLDKHHTRYAANLSGLLRAYPKCLLADNVHLRLAMLESDPQERAAKLEDCLERFPKTDARPETLFRLGVTYLEAEATSRGRAALEKLLRDYPDDTLWTPLARDRLRDLAAVDGGANP